MRCGESIVETEGKYLAGSPPAVDSNNVKLKGILLLVGAIIVWGANWPVMKSGLSHISPIWLSSLRFATGGICLFALQALTGKLRFPPRKDWPLVASVGLLQMMTFTALGAIAMTEVPAGRSAVLAYTTPLWVTPIAVLFFRESLSRRQWLGSLLGAVGVVVMFNPFTFNWGEQKLVMANFMLLVASFTWAICILHLRHHKGVCSAYELAPWQMLLASIPLVIMARIIDGPYDGDGSTSFIEIDVYGAFCYGILFRGGECSQYVAVEYQYVYRHAWGACDRFINVSDISWRTSDGHAGDRSYRDLNRDFDRDGEIVAGRQ